MPDTAEMLLLEGPIVAAVIGEVEVALVVLVPLLRSVYPSALHIL